MELADVICKLQQLGLPDHIQSKAESCAQASGEPATMPPTSDWARGECVHDIAVQSRLTAHTAGDALAMVMGPVRCGVLDENMRRPPR